MVPGEHPRSDFIFTLHSHLPYVLNHGRWPHGSDWICEAALDTYLPLLEVLRSLAAEAVPTPVTIGFTPVLANQLMSPVFVSEMETFLEQRIKACDEAPASLAATGDTHLLPIVDFWRERLIRLRELFHDIDQDLIGAFRALEAAGRIEIISSAATHGYLPLLARDESIRLQLAVGVSEHKRIFGRSPKGCWLPECAYRPRGPWDPWPTAPRSGVRRGIEEHLADAGFQFFFVDAHLAAAGRPLGTVRRSRRRSNRAYTSQARRSRQSRSAPLPRVSRGTRLGGGLCARSPGLDAGVESLRGISRRRVVPGVPQDALARRPQALARHRPRRSIWDTSSPTTLKPRRGRARDHANHFAHLLTGISADRRRTAKASLLRRSIPSSSDTGGSKVPVSRRACTARSRACGTPFSRPLARSTWRRIRLAAAIRLPWGSWGANGDSSMWLSESDRVDMGAALAAGAVVLGRRSHCALDSSRPPGAGPGSKRAATGPVVRLAVHHLHRRGGRLCREEISRALRSSRAA